MESYKYNAYLSKIRETLKSHLSFCTTTLLNTVSHKEQNSDNCLTGVNIKTAPFCEQFRFCPTSVIHKRSAFDFKFYS